MKRTVVVIARILLGLIFVVFGLNGFFVSIISKHKREEII